ncbi:MAG: glycosyltransferase [Bacteroidales bacterium]|nr:glycosyltransferase [Bacteroidales bacterium]
MYWIPAILTLPYLILFLVIYRHLLKASTYRPGKVPEESVSVIIACRNEEKNIEKLLKDLAVQDYPPHLFEVIVVDDNSDDQTAGIASTFKGLINLKVISNEGSGKKSAIRTGIGSSKGRLIITTDADCRMGNGWISTITSFHNDFKPDMIICPVKLGRSPGFFGKFQELEFLGLQGITAGTALAGSPVMCNGASLAFTREVYMRHSHNLHLKIASGDDIFLMHSLKNERGSAISWLESPGSMVIASPAGRLSEYLKQRRRWISKGGAYRDPLTICLAIVTFFTISLEISLLAATLANKLFLPALVTVFFVKSVPDFLILQNTASRYSEQRLMKWFLPAQVIYPFYVMSVFFYSLFTSGGREFSFPSQRGTLSS